MHDAVKRRRRSEEAPGRGSLDALAIDVSHGESKPTGWTGGLDAELSGTTPPATPTLTASTEGLGPADGGRHPCRTTAQGLARAAATGPC